MSAILLCCVILLSTYASSAVIGRDDAVQPDDGFQIIKEKSQHILVEEVDRYGNSVIRDMEVPDFDESWELQEDKERREEQEREFRQESILQNQMLREKYGCELQDEELKRKCLIQHKESLKRTYQDMKIRIQSLVKEINAKLKEMGDVVSEESLSDDFVFTSGYSPGDVIRLDNHISIGEKLNVRER